MNRGSPGPWRSDAVRVPPSLLLKLAISDLRGNRRATLLLASIICFSTFPFLVLSSLRLNYVNHIRATLEQTTPAKRIDLLSTTGMNATGFSPADLHELEQHPSIQRVVPHRNRSVELFAADGSLHRYNGVATVDGDPELLRLGLKRTPLSRAEADPAVGDLVLHRRQLEDLQLKPGDPIRLVVTRVVDDQPRSYPIPFRIGGIVEGSDQRNIYLPLPIADQFEFWSLGYQVEVGDTLLPAFDAGEEQLGPPRFKAVNLLLREPPNETIRSSLKLFQLELQPLTSNDDGHLYRLSFKDGRELTEHHWRDRVRLVFFSYAHTWAPWLPPLKNVRINDRPIELHCSPPSWQSAPRGGGHGSAMVYLSSDVYKNLSTRFTARLQLGDQVLSIKILDRAFSGEHGEVPASLLYRLHQVAIGEARTNTASEFIPIRKGLPEPSYIGIAVHVKHLEDVSAMTQRLVQQFPGVHVEGRLHLIGKVQDLSRMIANLVLLITLFGATAIICATAGVMMENVERRRRQIGMLRVLGFPHGAVILYFLIQISICALIGFTLAALLQWLPHWLLDNPTGHRLLGIPVPDGVQLFRANLTATLTHGVAIFLICLFSGLFPALQASRIDPGIILAEP